MMEAELGPHQKLPHVEKGVLQLLLGLTPYLRSWMSLALTASPGSELFLPKGLKKYNVSIPLWLVSFCPCLPGLLEGSRVRREKGTLDTQKQHR